jgi:cellulose synthase operon protein C
VRTLNVRFTVILLVSILVLGVGVYFLHGIQVKATAPFLLDKAEEIQKDLDQAKKEKNLKELDKAYKDLVNHYQIYLSIYPDNVDVLERRAMLLVEFLPSTIVLETLPQYNKAYEALDDVLRKDENREKSREKLIELAMKLARYSDAEKLLRYFLKKYPENPKFLLLQGQCLLARHDERGAETCFRKAVESGPKQIDAYPSLMRLLAASRRLEEADAVMDKMVQVNPKNVQALLYQTQYSLMRGRVEKARENVAEALKLSPDDYETLLWATQCALSSKDNDQARNYAQKSVKLFPERSAMYAVLSEIEDRANNHDKALEILNQGLKAVKDERELAYLTWKKVLFLLNDRQYETARQITAELDKRPEYKGRLDFVNGMTHNANGEWRQAVSHFEKAEPALKEIQGSQAIVTENQRLLKILYIQLGGCYGRLRNPELQLKAANRALDLDPLFEPARRLKIDALLSTGRTKEAEREYPLLKEDPSRVLLSQIQLQVQEILKQPKAQRNWDDVEKSLDEAAKTVPDSPQILAFRCEILIDKGKLADAEKLLQQQMQKSPKSLPLWNLRVNLALLGRDWKKADEALQHWENELGDSAALRSTKIQLYLRRYAKEAGPYVWKLEKDIETFTPQEQLDLYVSLLQAAGALGDQENLKRLSELIAKMAPGNVDVQFMRMDHAYKRRDRKTMESALQALKKIEGEEGPYGSYGQALLAELRYREKKDQKLLKQALDYLAQAQEKRPTWLKVPLIRGAIYEELGDEKSSLENYMEAINGGEYNTVAIRNTLDILFRQQRFTEAQELLRMLEQQHASLAPDIQKKWSQLLLQQGELDPAVKKIRETVGDDTRDGEQLIWRGQMLGAAAAKALNEGRKDAESLANEAENSFRRAVDLNGAIPDSWIALVFYLAKREKNSEAETALNQARKKLSGPDADLALATGYEAIDQHDKAQALYQAALAAKPDEIAVIRRVVEFYLRNNRMKEAEPLLQRILKGKIKADPQDACWARRNMAVIVSSSGEYNAIQKARQLIQENLRQFPDSVNDQRILALIDLSDPSPQRREEGMKAFQKMIAEGKASSDDLFTLANQYLGKNDWKNANELFLKLLALYGDNPRYLSAYIQALLNHDEAGNAEPYLNSLKKVAPLDRQTTQLEAETLFRRGKPQEAMQLLQGFVDKPHARPADRSMRIFYMADVMERLARRFQGTEHKSLAQEYLRTAEMYYRQYVETHPSQKTVLANFLSRQGRRDEAVKLLEDSWTDSDPNSLGSACLQVSAEGKGNKEIVNRAERILLEARSKSPSQPTLLLALGAINTGRGNFADAEKFYREVLQKNAGHTVAMNNLAVLFSVTGKNLDEALQLIDKAIELNGPLPAMCDTRACVFLARHESQKALAEIGRALAGEETPERLFHQALAYEQLGQNQAAAAAMVKALDEGLTQNQLLAPEHKDFERLQKAAQAAMPKKKR